ncbi:MAG: efflux RND transporter periplasmic adaptor subunit [Comamonadaceae bacterium]|nr:efflux RND transporter periplasmic adaptor subunit [Comamonadaceae bacterium]
MRIDRGPQGAPRRRRRPATLIAAAVGSRGRRIRPVPRPVRSGRGGGGLGDHRLPLPGLHPAQRHRLRGRRSARRRSRRRPPAASSGSACRRASRVKEGEVIARLENRDVRAQRRPAPQAQRARPRARTSAQARGRTARRRAAAAAHAGPARRRSSSRRPRWTPPRRATTRRARRSASCKRGRSRSPQADAARRAGVAVDQTLIRAPFDGVVLTKSANVGDIVTPFSSAPDSTGAVVTMADMSTLEVEADVSESQPAEDHASASPAEIQLDAFPDLRFRGRSEPHGADRRPRQGDAADQGEVRRARPARAAGHEREGRVPVAGSSRPTSASRCPRCGRMRSSQRDGAAVVVRRSRGRRGAEAARR